MAEALSAPYLHIWLIEIDFGGVRRKKKRKCAAGHAEVRHSGMKQIAKNRVTWRRFAYSLRSHLMQY